MTPGMAARRMAAPGAIAPASAKFDFWRSMADLGALVMRSGAPGLRWRVGASLVLVFLGKLAGVAAPVALGEAINRLAPGGGQAAELGFDFLLLLRPDVRADHRSRAFAQESLADRDADIAHAPRARDQRDLAFQTIHAANPFPSFPICPC